jgi:hypothetical protein
VQQGYGIAGLEIGTTHDAGFDRHAVQVCIGRFGRCCVQRKQSITAYGIGRDIEVEVLEFRTPL